MLIFIKFSSFSFHFLQDIIIVLVSFEEIALLDVFETVIPAVKRFVWGSNFYR